MIIRQASGPTRCTLCLQDADEAIKRHLRENKPCTHPYCPLHKVISAALEHQNSPRIVFGISHEHPPITFRRERARYPSMIHVLSKKTTFEKFFHHIINQLKKIRKLWES